MINNILAQRQPVPSIPDNATGYEDIVQKAAALAATFSETHHYDNVFQGAVYDIAAETIGDIMGPFGYAWKIEVSTSSRFLPQGEHNHVNKVVPLCTITADAGAGRVRMIFGNALESHVKGIVAAFEVWISTGKAAA